MLHSRQTPPMSLPPIRRPLFLEGEERMREGYPAPGTELGIQNPFHQPPDEQFRAALEALMTENRELKQRVEEMEVRREEEEKLKREGEGKFSTPDSEEQKKKTTQEVRRPQDPHPPRRTQDPQLQEDQQQRRMQDPQPQRRTQDPVRPEDPQQGRAPEPTPLQGEPPAFQVMLKILTGMQEMQKQLMETRDNDGQGSDNVRSLTLPPLAEWSASTGPIDLNDWLALIDPMMSDLSNSSGEWWRQLLHEAQQWYHDHLQLQPLHRITHDAKPSQHLAQQKWKRLERRASTMLLMAVPQSQREEMIAAKKLDSLAIICQLLVSYKPGGMAEKELILRSLEVPGEATTIVEAVQALRRWSRWRRRASELQISEPDPFLLLKGLNRIVRKPLENNKDLGFRINLARSTLHVDATPTSRSVSAFATHLIAEFEQVAHLEGGGKKKTEEKVKRIAAPGEEEGKTTGSPGGSPGGRTGEESPKARCKFFLTEGGCKRGKACTWSHDGKDDKKRCWNCGSVDHFAPACTRPKSQAEGKQRPKAQKIEGESAPSSPTKEEKPDSPGTSMAELLEEANKMLKTLTANASTASSSGGSVEGEAKDDVVERLQQQLNSLKQKQKAFRLNRIAQGSNTGLLDSGATHPLRSPKDEEDVNQYKRVEATLADGRVVELRMSRGGAMISPDQQVEPIVPLGRLAQDLGCRISWDQQGVVIDHPMRGRLKVHMVNGCPQVSKSLALDLINEMEEKEEGMVKKGKDYEREVKWMKDLVQTHPVLKKLPQRIKDRLVVDPTGWKTLPMNKRQRKRVERDGLIAHVYAGEESGFTFEKAWKQHGGDPMKVVEIDIKRGQEHDMLSDTGPYPALLKAALQGKLHCILGGPNCRTRSVLRHYPIQGVPDCPRPIREWGGGEHGKENISEKERDMIQEDDVMMWRMLFTYMVAQYVRVAMGIPKKVGLLVEQPAAPDYKPQVVSWWKTPEWKEIKEEFSLEEMTVNQGSLGGEAIKPTTLGTNLQVDIDDYKMPKAINPTIKDSKKLARWAPGLMQAVARAVKTHVTEERANVKAVTFEEHLRNNHVPYRKDCRVCQESQQQVEPHRRQKYVRGGVLSIDVAGPFPYAGDQGGYKARYLLVGAYAWYAPKEDKKLKEDEVEELKGDEPPLEEDPKEADRPPKEDSPQEADRPPEEGVLREAARPPKEDSPQEADRPPEIPSKEDLEEERKIDEEDPQVEGEDDSKEEKDQEVKEDVDMSGLELRVFRMATPLRTKKATETTRGTMEFILKLQADGYVISGIHSDQGHEFHGEFKRWANRRAIRLTKTAGDDPQGNGRAENAVKTMKTQIRRTLRAANVGSEWWPWASRYVDGVNRYFRLGERLDFPPFLQEVTVRKRKWRRDSFEVTTERVKYLYPTMEDHGHWVVKDKEQPRLTKTLMRRSCEPFTEEKWAAIEKEYEDAIATRRRLREKTAVRKIDGESNDDSRIPERKMKTQVTKLIEEEMKKMIEDDFELAAEEMKILGKLKRMVEEPTEEEDVLQTKIVSSKEVEAHWKEWLPCIKEEVDSLLEEKQAFRKVTKAEVQEIVRKAAEEGKKVEFIPSKSVYTKKPQGGGHKKKARWVICGNYESHRPTENNYSSGADAASFRLVVWTCSKYQWEAVVVDIKSAFLNADMEEDDVVIIVKPPPLYVERKVLEKDVYYQPIKAVYGLRRSPRLWGKCRDTTMKDMRIPCEVREEQVMVRLVPLEAEPNVWRAINERTEEVLGMVMTYVDDMFVAGVPPVKSAIVQAIRQAWTTSAPQEVSQEPTRFLGMEVTKKRNEEVQREDWMLTQQAFIQDLIQKEDQVKERKIPITRDQAAMEDKGELPTAEAVRACQKVVGEMLWLVTRTRPDIMFALARMGSNITKTPEAVLEAATQLKGYIKRTQNEGIKFSTLEDSEIQLQVYSDASFAPEGEESHGCFIVTMNGSPVFWRSGRQHLISLSTAESELLEIVDAMIAGESISAIAEEMHPGLVKIALTDSLSSVATLTTDGGSWRTRHLRVRSAYARQSISRGEWLIQHVPGEHMLADVGTKALTSIRLEHLKKAMGMSKREEKYEETEKSKEEEKDESKPEERKGGRDHLEVVQKAAQVVRLITLAAAIAKAEAHEDEQKEEEENYDMIIYTISVIVLTLLVQSLWKLGVQVLGMFFEEERGNPGNRPEALHGSISTTPETGDESHEEGKEKEDDEEEKTETEDEEKKTESEEEREIMRERIRVAMEEIQEDEDRRWEAMNHTPWRAEQNRMMDADPPKRPLGQPFLMLITKTGRVYHTTKRCGYLTSHTTGAAREYTWCEVCRWVASHTRGAPPPGVPLYAMKDGSVAHTSDRCPRMKEIAYPLRYLQCSQCSGGT
eukprot:Skav213064  [mRNA]  locus=scaffold364:594309:601403:- [translate_table: standard]